MSYVVICRDAVRSRFFLLSSQFRIGYSMYRQVAKAKRKVAQAYEELNHMLEELIHQQDVVLKKMDAKVKKLDEEAKKEEKRLAEVLARKTKKQRVGIKTKDELVESEKNSISAFQQSFLGPEAVSALETHFNECISLLNSNSDYFPYISIVQSSGSEKTRLVFEYAQQKQMPLFYACFRQATESGYPSGSLFRDKILDAVRDDSAARAFVRALMTQIQVLQSKQGLAQFYSDEIKKGQNLSSAQRDDSLFASFWNDVLAAAADNDGDDDEVVSGSESKAGIQRFQGMQHVVVFDEARALLGNSSEASYFIHLRRAISWFALDLGHAGIMIIFVDKTSKIDKALPPVAQMSPSWLGPGFQVLPSFRNNVTKSANLIEHSN